MESFPDYASIIHSQPFTFLVGPKHAKLTIQSGLAKHVSKPLDHLMNSGLTRESKHHIAVLEDEDVETFVAFSEYAYTGDYRVPPRGFREDVEANGVNVNNNPFNTLSPASPFASAVPPSAPSPPRSVNSPDRDYDAKLDPDYFIPAEEQQRAQEEVKDKNRGTGDDFFTPVGPPQDWECAIEEPTEQALATPPADEYYPFRDEDVPSKGKKGKKGKKNKKAAAPPPEEPTSTLTPPLTPPSAKPVDEVEMTPTFESTATQGEPVQSTEPLETVEVDQAAASVEAGAIDEPIDRTTLMTESWEKFGVTPPEDEAIIPLEANENEESKEVKKDKEEDESPSGRMMPMIDTSFAKQEFPSRLGTGISLWDKFAAIDYVDHRELQGTRPFSPLPAQSGASKSDLPYLVFHAKVYVFAARYLIPALAQLCLRKLHDDLLNLGFPDPHPGLEGADVEQIALTSAKARMVLDLLHYTYTKTTRLEPINPSSATQLRDNELRKLVVHYAACKVRELAEYCPPMESNMGSPRAERPSTLGLRSLLDTTTELASDLVYRLM